MSELPSQCCPSHCCLCGLLCSLEHAGVAAAPLAAVSSCARRRQWQERSQTVLPGSLRPGDEEVTALKTLFSPEHKSLIWIDAADVATLRAAVQLAQATGATLHVGGTTGAEIAQRVLTSEGWLGTSLGEVATHADLIITLGDSLLSEFPLLSERFIQPTVKENRGRWLHLSSQAQPQPVTAGATRHYWPRQEWYNRLSELLMRMQPHALVSSTPELQQLSAALQTARSCVWLWDVDEFCDSIDELTIRRLLGIARKLSEHSRCSLLAMDTRVGRVTADETLLWLTGCRSTARYINQRWVCPPEMAEYTLDAWAATFDKILLVQTVPTVGALPDLPCSHYLLPATRLPGITAQGGSAATPRITSVAAVGIETPGHLFRGDRATMFFCQPEPAELARRDTTHLPTAAALLDAVQGRIVAQEQPHVN